MPRRARPSANVLFRLRAWFGLRQDQLALLCGVSKAVIQAGESYRRSIPSEVLLALVPLLTHLPPAPAAAATMPEAAETPASAGSAAQLLSGAPAPDAAELDFRRRCCRQQAAGLRTQAAQIEQRARVAERWAQALPALLTAYPAPTAEAIAADEYAAEHHTWLVGWLHRQARPLPAQDVTRWHLLQARIIALEAEAAALG